MREKKRIIKLFPDLKLNFRKSVCSSEQRKRNRNMRAGLAHDTW